MIRLVLVSDRMQLLEFQDLFRAILGWNGELGYIFLIHGQEFNSFHRKTRFVGLQKFHLRRREKLLYVWNMLHMWE